MYTRTQSDRCARLRPRVESVLGINEPILYFNNYDASRVSQPLAAINRSFADSARCCPLPNLSSGLWQFTLRPRSRSRGRRRAAGLENEPDSSSGAVFPAVLAESAGSTKVGKLDKPIIYARRPPASIRRELLPLSEISSSSGTTGNCGGAVVSTNS